MTTAALFANAFIGEDLDYYYMEKTNTFEVHLNKHLRPQDNSMRYKIKSVKIPATVKRDGKMLSVTVIGDFSNTTLKKITLPNTITTICWHAFYNCPNLSSITIPSSVTMIQSEAFDYYSIKEIHISDIAAWCNINFSDSHISKKSSSLRGVDLYLDDIKITDLIIPNSVSKINDVAFGGCCSLVSVTIPNSVIEIGKGAFEGCPNLSSLNISNSVTKIGSAAFDKTPWYSSQPDGLIYAGMVAYSYKGEMPDGTSIELKDGCTGIAEGAFAGCSGLKEITIPSSVTSIGAGAFKDCTGLSNVYCEIKDPSVFGDQSFGKNVVVQVPNESVELYQAAWKNAAVVGAGSSIDVLGAGRNFVQDGIRYSVNNDGKTMTMCGPEKSKEDFIGDLVIPETVTFEGVTCTVTSIGYAAFCGCKGLTSLTIPNSVTSIGSDAFSGCSGLTSVSIPNSVTEIGHKAFEYCSGLTSLTIPNSVTKIDAWAFGGCSGLTSLTIGNSVATIGFNAFEGCTSLTSVTWNAKNCGDFGDTDKRFGSNKIKSIIFGNEVEHIPARLCWGLKDLTSVTIPNSVTSIGKMAFCGCEGLTSLNIPNSVTEIGEMAFYDCKGLTSVIIKNPNIKIESSAFHECDNIRKLQVPREFETIPSNLYIFPRYAGPGRPPTAQELNLVGGRANYNKLSQGKITRGMKLKHIENYSDLLDKHYIEGAYISIYKRLWTRDNVSQYKIGYLDSHDSGYIYYKPVYYVTVRNGVVTSVSY